ncbi:MAG: hypothetical protein NT040_03690 [Bacteroidetes bacterium]|nr:hypothetical protein [Bacteroidota bacterium]
MMINIAVAEINQTYGQGLKTMLEQVEGFKVVLLPVSGFRPVSLTNLNVDVLLVDEDLYQSVKPGNGEAGAVWPVTRTIVMTMDVDEFATLPYGVDAIFKGSGKRKFSEKILKLMMEQIKANR